MNSVVELGAAQARRIALAAQGFADQPHRTPTMRTLARTVRHTGVLQVDSVNVLARAHLMPLYSRMGPYSTDLLQRAASGREQRRLVEYWAHVQALMPVDLWPLMRHRMEDYRVRRPTWNWSGDDALAQQVLAAVGEGGPVTARDLEEEFADGPRKREHWGWNWSQARGALDFLYRCGDVAIAGRNAQFEVRYDLTERVIPSRILSAPIPSVEEAHRELVRRAARSHGVATARCLADYYRMRLTPKDGLAGAKEAIAELVEAGELIPARVEGWARPAYLWHQARSVRKIDAATLLSPFDPVVWERERAEKLFDFSYRIEIYVPPEKRQYGYYVLPFLLADQLVARVDLKADRATGRLLVRGAYAEAGAPEDTTQRLALELTRLASWRGLDAVIVEPRGDLAPGLMASLR